MSGRQKILFGWRLSLAIFAFLLGLILALPYFGIKTLDCGQCASVRDRWYSLYFLLALIFASGVSAYCVARNLTAEYRRLAIFQGVAGLIALGLTIQGRLMCPFCISAQLVWIAVAVDALGAIPGRALACAVAAFALLNCRDAYNMSFAATKPLAAFEPRPFEPRAVGSPAEFVIFTDPCCPYCREEAARLDISKISTPIVYRWCLMPGHGSRSVVLAALIESAKTYDFVKGVALQSLVYAGAQAPSDRSIVASGAALGLPADQIQAWLATPDVSSLSALANDGRLAESLDVSHVPQLCEVDTSYSAGAGTPVSISIVPTRRRLDALAVMMGEDLSRLADFVK